MSPPRRVLVSRTDRLGDVVLTLPLCGLLRAHRDVEVVMLVRRYARDVVAACDAVSEIVVWDDASGEPREDGAAAALLRDTRVDTILHVRPDRRVAAAARRAGIATRIGTSHRLYHWWTCNRLEALGRRGSSRHEAQLDVALARSLFGTEDVLALDPDALAPYGRLRPRVALPPDLAALVGGDRFTLAIHPRSGGSASEWPLERWSALIASLDPARVRVLVTGSAAEGATLGAWLRALPPHAHDVTGRTDLAALVALLARVDGFVAASTGPLHVAAAAGARALGLFSPRRPIHPARWRPIGANAELLVADVPADIAAREPASDDVARIGVDAVSAVVARWVRERGGG